MWSFQVVHTRPKRAPSTRQAWAGYKAVEPLPLDSHPKKWANEIRLILSKRLHVFFQHNSADKVVESD